jgi:nucleotide-binding universal stress UspA family protein
MSVLVGYVPTRHGAAALHAALVEARLRNTSVIVVNASAGDATADPNHLNTEQLAALNVQLTDSGVPHSVEFLSGRDPVAEIVSLSEDPDVDLVVIGLRHRNPVGKLIFGSTAQRILLEVLRPVLAVKAGSDSP